MIPHRWWIRATYITTGRPWVTTDELERSQRSKLAAIWAQGLEPGWVGRGREILFTAKRAGHWPRAQRLVHNVVAHPLLELCPPLGEWLHDRTAPAEVTPLDLLLLSLAANARPSIPAPYVMTAPAALIPLLGRHDVEALAAAGVTEVPSDYVPGQRQIDAPRLPGGVLLVPVELVA